jgi:HAD-superfamily hydrolase (TIGR02245 family)
MAEPAEAKFEIAFGVKKAILALPLNCTIGDLKTELEERFEVASDKQKLVGLPAGLVDDTPFASLTALKRPVQKLILMGTTDAALRLQKELQEKALAEQDEAAAAKAVAAGVGEFGAGSSVGPDGEPLPVHLNPIYLQKIHQRAATYKPKMVDGFRVRAAGEPRRTAVFDLDYTVLDHRSVVERPSEMMRPFLHEMFSAVYASGYDIVIWSATSMRWIETKLRSFGCVNHPAYKFACLMDGGAMITVDSPEYGGRIDVKPLGVMWELFPEHTHPSTTIMFDDLRRNFLCNPQNGFRIKACRDLPNTRHEDRELIGIAAYLAGIARLPSFTDLNHRKWKKWLQENTDERLDGSESD